MYVAFIGLTQILFLNRIKSEKSRREQVQSNQNNTSTFSGIASSSKDATSTAKEITLHILKNSKQTATIGVIALAGFIIMILGMTIIPHSISISFITWCTVFLLSIYQTQDSKALKDLVKQEPEINTPSQSNVKQSPNHEATVFKGMGASAKFLEKGSIPSGTVFKGMDPTDYDNNEDFVSSKDIREGPSSMER